MKMTSTKLKDLLCERLQHPDRTFSYDVKKEELRIENTKTKKGITVSLAPLVAKVEIANEAAINETVYYVTEALEVMGKNDIDLNNQEANIYPVIRSTSFPVKNENDQIFVTDDHTAETRVYYALDLGNTYRLLEKNLIEKNGWTQEKVRIIAMTNLLKLSTKSVSDTVAGNVFYFVTTKDGYDASKILHHAWMKSMRDKIEGEMAVAVPHGDVCIVADIRNDTGYDILAQMCMSFFADGHVPITALSFLYDEKGALEPIFILGKNKKRV